MNKNLFLFQNSTKGILRIYNIQTDKSLLLKSNDIVKDIQSIRFKLDLGIFEQKTLQDEYESIGLELFCLEPFKIQEKDEALDLLLEASIKELSDKRITFYKD
ncbi:hypothetical protein [uncultured Sphaerochaeta sp.]|uniref:hypothetical protein n=1 Tax=uncultured Sphaerochaeta sp. TaxID=886478 RepID=UPI002A0A5B87|nr:hypothetical protein [uncultured Sphaerochaeta sp.]